MNPGIYKYTSPTGKIYIGKTIDLNRRKQEYKRLQCKNQPKLYYSFNKHGFENHIYEEIICDKSELIQLEIKLKEEVINNLGWDYALFCNTHDEGNNSLPLSIRTKISEANKGKHEWTEEMKIKAVHNRKQTIENNGGHNWGHKIKQSQTGVPKPGKYKPVYQYDNQGNFIQKWDSVKDAETYYGKDPNKDNISATARGNQKTAYGFVWSYSIIA